MILSPSRRVFSEGLFSAVGQFFANRIRAQRLQILLPEDAVHASAHQPGMEYNRVQTTAFRFPAPHPVQGSGVDKETFSLPYDVIGSVDRDTGGPGFDHQNLQFIMPVPRHWRFTDVVMIAGSGEPCSISSRPCRSVETGPHTLRAIAVYLLAILLHQLVDFLLTHSPVQWYYHSRNQGGMQDASLTSGSHLYLFHQPGSA